LHLIERTRMPRRTKDAFVWIVRLLRKHDVPFQVTGGLAARVYGARRKLADIDLDVPDRAIGRIASLVRPYIVKGPYRYRVKPFDVLLLTLRYKGQEIDLAGADSTRLFDRQEKKWSFDKADLKRSTKKSLYGMRVPIIRKQELLRYKKSIARAVDKEDVRALESDR
jgi:hypothetical protein